MKRTRRTVQQRRKVIAYDKATHVNRNSGGLKHEWSWRTFAFTLSLPASVEPAGIPQRRLSA
jgi:hypothetical protein